MEQISVSLLEINPSFLKHLSLIYGSKKQVSVLIDKNLATDNSAMMKLSKALPSANFLIKDLSNVLYDGVNDAKLSDFILKNQEIPKLIENYNMLKLKGQDLGFEAGYTIEQASIASQSINNWIKEINGTPESATILTPLEKFYRICAISANAFYLPETQDNAISSAKDMIEMLSGNKMFSNGYNELATCLCELSNIPCTRYPVVIKEHGVWKNKTLLCAKIVDTKYDINGIFFSDISSDCLKENFPAKPTTYSFTAITMKDLLENYKSDIVLESSILPSLDGGEICENKAKLFPLFKAEYNDFLTQNVVNLQNLYAKAKAEMKSDKEFSHQLKRLMKKTERVVESLALSNSDGADSSDLQADQLVDDLTLHLLASETNAHSKREASADANTLIDRGFSIKSISKAVKQRFLSMNLEDVYISSHPNLLQEKSDIEKNFSIQNFETQMEQKFYDTATKTEKITLGQLKTLLTNIGQSRRYTNSMSRTYTEYKLNSTILNLLTNEHFRNNLSLPNNFLIIEAIKKYPEIWNRFCEVDNSTDEAEKTQKIAEINESIAKIYENMSLSYKQTMHKLSDSSYERVKW